MSTVTRFFRKRTAYPKLLWLLAISCFLNIGGLSFLWPLNTVYIHNVLGKPLTVSGLVLLMNSAGASLGQLVGGVLFDRIGARPVLLLGLFSSAVLISLPGLVNNWPLYVIVMVLFGFTGSLAGPSLNALAARCWPEGGRRAFNFLYVANNLGVAAGSAVGGVVAQHSFHLAFLSASVTLLILTVFIFLFIREKYLAQAPSANLVEAAAGPEEIASTSDAALEKIPWLPVLALYFAAVLLWVVYVQWQSTIAAYLNDHGTPLSAYSVLWTLNGILIFCGQPLIAMAVRYCKTFAKQMMLGSVLFVLCFSLILSNTHYAMFVAGMVVLTLGEMLLWPVIPAAVSQLSPPHRLGFLQGLIGSASTFGRMLGPLIGGVLFDHTGFHTLLLCMIGLILVPMGSILTYARTRQRFFQA